MLLTGLRYKPTTHKRVQNAWMLHSITVSSRPQEREPMRCSGWAEGTGTYADPYPASSVGPLPVGGGRWSPQGLATGQTPACLLALHPRGLPPSSAHGREQLSTHHRPFRLYSDHSTLLSTRPGGCKAALGGPFCFHSRY